MRFIEAKDIIELLEHENIYSATGKVTMTLNGISVDVRQNDIVGNVLQEWLGEVLRKNNIYFRPAIGQTFPDFYLSESNMLNLCEMKTFLNSPNFDVANYHGYVDSISKKPYRLNSDYIIFEYTSSTEGIISIKNIWCKKVWEITGPANDYDLRCQRKKGQIVNIRPVAFNSTKAKIKPFNDLSKFLIALYKTHISVTNQSKVSKDWLKTIIEGYKQFSGIDLSSTILPHI